MTQEHPITPPPELVQQWWDGTHGALYEFESVATQAARWGADQELKACCEWLLDHGYDLCSPEMRKDRRPKPPSLKELALETLLSMQIQPCVINGINTNADLMAKYDILRRALESLAD